MIRINIEAEMPDEELQPFLQAIRSWERARPEIKMAIKACGDAMASDDVWEVFQRLEPSVPFGIKVGNRTVGKDGD